MGQIRFKSLVFNGAVMLTLSLVGVTLNFMSKIQIKSSPEKTIGNHKIIFEEYEYRIEGSRMADILELLLMSNEMKHLTSNISELAVVPSFSSGGEKISYLAVNNDKEVSFCLMNMDRSNNEILMERVGWYPECEDKNE